MISFIGVCCFFSDITLVAYCILIQSLVGGVGYNLAIAT